MCRFWQVFCLCLLGYLLLGISITNAAATSNLTLTNQQSKFTAASVAEYFEDPSGHLTFEQATSASTQLAFKQNTQKQLNFGQSNSAWWIRFKIQNQADTAWYLLLDASLGHNLDLYVFPQNRQNLQIANNSHPYAKPVPNYIRQAWSLHLPKNQSFHVYLRVTNPHSNLALPISLVNADAFVGYSIKSYRLISFVYAGMIILGLYQLFMFFVLKEVNYFLLAIYIFSVMLCIHRTNPVFPELSFLSSGEAYFYSAPVFIMLAVHTEFTRRVLDIKDYAPKLNVIYKCIALIIVSMVVFAEIVPEDVWLSIPLTAASLVLSIISSHYIARKGHRIARYFSWIYWVPVGVHLPGLLLFLFRAEQWQAYLDTLASIGALIFMLLLALLQAERMRLLREQMKQIEAASEAKEEFLAIMSHELRTPMNAIVGLNSLLKLSSLNNKQQDYVEKMDLATEHVIQLVTNVLDYAKLGNYTFQLKPEPCSLALVINSTLPLIQQQAEQKGLKFEFESTGDLEVNCLLDRTCITQVLVNLLNNAVKYTNEGSVILKVQAGLTKHKQQFVKFTIIDTGVGLPLERLSYLFEPFTQLAPQNARQGVGLGLAISKRLITAMDSELKISSQIAKGTTISFELKLPLISALASTKSDAGSLAQGLRLLVADNAELNHPEASAMLRQLGADVQVFPNDKRAILCLQEQEVDMVLVDMTLPEAGGLELSRWVRHSGRNPKLPIVALTSTTVKEVELACHEIGISAYIKKPIDYHSLSSVLNKALAA